MTKMIWLIVLITAAYCVPLLERNDIRNFVNLRKSDINELYEQQYRQPEGKNDLTGAILGTNYEKGQVNKKELLLKHIVESIIGENTNGEYQDDEAEDIINVISDGDSLTQFKGILDGILGRVGPPKNDLESIEKDFETKGDYNSVILDFMNMFNNGDTATDTFNEHGAFDDKKDLQVNKHSIADAVVRNKLAEAYLRKFLQTSGLSEVNNDKVRTFFETFGINIGSLKKQRTKRLTYDDGKTPF